MIAFLIVLALIIGWIAVGSILCLPYLNALYIYFNDKYTYGRGYVNAIRDEYRRRNIAISRSIPYYLLILSVWPITAPMGLIYSQAHRLITPVKEEHLREKLDAAEEEQRRLQKELLEIERTIKEWYPSDANTEPSV